MQNEEKETLSSRILAQKSKHRWEAQAMKRHREIPPFLPLSRPLNPELLTFSAQLHFLSHKHLVANSLLKHIRIQRCYVRKASYRTASHSENRKCRTLCAQLLRISRWQQRSLKSRTSLFWGADPVPLYSHMPLKPALQTGHAKYSTGKILFQNSRLAFLLDK